MLPVAPAVLLTVAVVRAKRAVAVVVLPVGPVKFAPAMGPELAARPAARCPAPTVSTKQASAAMSQRAGAIDLRNDCRMPERVAIGEWKRAMVRDIEGRGWVNTTWLKITAWVSSQNSPTRPCRAQKCREW